MYFNMKNILINNYNYISKHALIKIQSQSICKKKKKTSIHGKTSTTQCTVNDLAFRQSQPHGDCYLLQCRCCILQCTLVIRLF